MKIALMVSFLGFALFWGLKGGIGSKKNTSWKIVSIAFIFFGAIFTFIPPLAGTFSDAKELAFSPELKNVPVYCQMKSNSNIYDSISNS